MQKVLKWIGLVLGSLLGIVILAALILFFLGAARFNKVYDFPPSNLTLPTDAASLNLASIASKRYARAVMAPT